MGRIVLVCRLAARDLRRHPAQALLLLLVITAAMATLTLGLILYGVTRQPYEQTRAATAGPDVVAATAGVQWIYSSGSAGQSTEISASDFSRLAALPHAPGVTAHSGPYPVAWPVLRAHGITAEAMAEGRDEARAAVDQPKVIQGTWVRRGGVVVERAFADALGVHVGDHITLDGRRFRVTGVGVTAAIPVFSQVCFYGGCSWIDGKGPSFATSLVTPGNPLTYYLNLKLKDPAAAPAFVREHQLPPGNGPPPLTAWQDLRDSAAALVAREQQVLVPASWLRALLAGAGVAVVAGGRMAEQEKRVGLLKAVGGTPPLAAAVLLAEHLVVALAAAATGLAAGWLAAPLLTSPGPPALTWSTVLVVAVAAVAVAAASTLRPALRAARTSTMAALAGTARPPQRWASLIKRSAGMPVPLLLGLRLMARQPRRGLLSTASFAVTATAIVAVLIYHTTVSQHSEPSWQWPGPPDPGQGRISEVLLVITVVLVILAAANAIFTTWATALDARRFLAIARALGATPQQTVAALSASQLPPALAGALIGIPAGATLYAAVAGAGPQGNPPAWWLLAMILGMLLAVAGLTAIPARISAHRPAAEILQSGAG